MIHGENCATIVEENGIAVAVCATKIIHRSKRSAATPGKNARMGEMSASMPAINESSIASETTGNAKIFAGKETNESTPVKYSSAGSTYICTEIVEAAIERTPNFSGS